MNYLYLWFAFALINLVFSLALEICGEKKRERGVTLPFYATPFFNAEKIKETNSYQSAYYHYSLVSLPFSFLLNSLLFFSFFYSKVYYSIQIDNEFFHFFIFSFVISVVNYIFNLPFDLYKTFYIEKKFSFSTITPSLYIKDEIKNGVISIPLSFVLYFALFYFVDTFPVLWPLLSAILFFSFVLIFNIIYPLWIAPLFNKFTLLGEGELNDKICAVFERVGFKIKSIYIVDSSKRTKHSNAYISGFGKQKRIVLYDNLIEQLSVDEIVAVLCHEAGHAKHHDIVKKLITMPFFILFVFYVVYFISQSDAIFTSFGFEREHVVIALNFIFLTFAPIVSYCSIFSNILSRKKEKNADIFSKETLGSGNALASALMKLSKENLSDLTPTALDKLLNYSHPPLFERCEYLLSDSDS